MHICLCACVVAEHSRVSRDFNNSCGIRRSKTWKMSSNTTVFGLSDAQLLANITLFDCKEDQCFEKWHPLVLVLLGSRNGVVPRSWVAIDVNVSIRNAPGMFDAKVSHTAPNVCKRKWLHAVGVSEMLVMENRKIRKRNLWYKEIQALTHGVLALYVMKKLQ